jgi:hypothetical protein
MAVKLSASRAGHPSNFQVLISVRGWVDPQGHSEAGLEKLKIQLIHQESNQQPSGL